MPRANKKVIRKFVYELNWRVMFKQVDLSSKCIPADHKKILRSPKKRGKQKYQWD